jgi:hypothetical protein
MHLSSGLYDFGARWYDPFLQRWLTEDPLGEAGGLNLYRFAANDPLNQVDPWGQWLLFDRQAWGRLLQDLLLGDAGPALDPDANLALRQAAGVGLSAYTDENGTPVPLGELLATGLGAGVETAALLYTPGGEAAGALAARLSGKVCRALSRTGARAGAEAAEQALTAAAKSGPLRFTQTTASPMFSAEGSFAGRSISQVADALRSGTMTAADVPVEFIVRDGNRLIVNTRSSLALRQAGIPEAQWNLINRTGVAEVEANITQRLLRNGLGNEGTEVLRITGSGSGASTYRWP